MGETTQTTAAVITVLVLCMVSVFFGAAAMAAGSEGHEPLFGEAGPEYAPGWLCADPPGDRAGVVMEKRAPLLLQTGQTKTTACTASDLVSPGPGNQTQPDIDGDRVVWMDDRNGNWDLFLYEPQNGSYPAVMDKEDEIHPSLFGNLLAYQKKTSSGNTDIWVFDLSSGKRWPLTTHPSRQEKPSAGGDFITYEDYREGKPAIWITWTTTRETRKISSGRGAATNPHTDGKKIVYEQDNGKGTHFIRVYDSKTGETTSVTPEQEVYTDKTSPGVSGNFVCYLDQYDPGRFSVEVYDLITQQRLIDLESDGTQKNPTISPGLLAWEERDGDARRVHSLDLFTGKARVLCIRGSDQGSPDVTGNAIVFEETFEGRAQVCRAGYALPSRLKTVPPLTPGKIGFPVTRI